MQRTMKWALAMVLTMAPMSALAGERGHVKLKFPMPAAEYRAKMSERQANHQQRFERKLAEKKLSAERMKEIRAKIAARRAKVNAKIVEVSKDGTVTEEEAKAVREVAREGRKHGKQEKN